MSKAKSFMRLTIGATTQTLDVRMMGLVYYHRSTVAGMKLKASMGDKPFPLQSFHLQTSCIL